MHWYMQQEPPNLEHIDSSDYKSILERNLITPSHNV